MCICVYFKYFVFVEAEMKVKLHLLNMYLPTFLIIQENINLRIEYYVGKKAFPEQRQFTKENKKKIVLCSEIEFNLSIMKILF